MTNDSDVPITRVAAKRIAAAHNHVAGGRLGGCGKLVFGRDGSGGEWYSDSAYGFAGLLAVPVGRRAITAGDVIEMFPPLTDPAA